VIVVDDVMTTGATLEECAKVLKESGVKYVYGLVLARGV
jgi:predicted amidophosphoribosyltransferase